MVFKNTFKEKETKRQFLAQVLVISAKNTEITLDGYLSKSCFRKIMLDYKSFLPASILGMGELIRCILEPET